MRLQRQIGTCSVLLAALSLSYGVGSYALIDPDEGRNAEVALEMAQGGSLVVAYLDGLPYLDKPFLYFAAVASSMRIFGASEWAARLPGLLATWATLALTVWFSRRLFGDETAWLAGLAWVTAPLSIGYARTVIFDSTLTFFVSLAIVAFYMAIEQAYGATRGANRPWWSVLAWVAMAAAVFTKGPIGLLLPLMVAVAYAAWRRRSAAVWRPAGWLLFLALIAPWCALAERTVPGFLKYSLTVETWQRLTTDAMDRTGPVWYFLPVLLGGTLPWCALVLAAGWRRTRAAVKGETGHRLIFLGLWIALPFLVFSFSQSKRAGYLLPVVPAVALLAAWSWSDEASRPRGSRAGALASVFVGALLLTVGAGAGAGKLSSSPPSLVGPTAGVLGGVMVAASVVAWFMARHRLAPLAAPLFLALPLALVPVAIAPVMREIGQDRSQKEMAAAVAPLLTPTTQIMAIETYSPSLAFYLGGARIQVATTTGKPMRSNFAIYAYPQLVGAGSSTLLPKEAWPEALATCPRPYLFLLRPDYEHDREMLVAAGAPLVWEDEEFVLMGPCRPPAGPQGEQDRREAVAHEDR